MPIKFHPNFFYRSLGLLAIFLYSTVIFQNAINMPKWDDFIDVLYFMNQWIDGKNTTEKIHSLFLHKNEHLPLTTHLIVLLQYLLNGKINFFALILIGNLFYLGSAVLLWFFYKQQTQAAYLFAIIPLIACSFYPHESTLWAMTAISNQAVIFFSLLAIYNITAHRNFRSACISATLAILSQSNGFLLLPVIAVFLQQQHKTLLKPWLCFSVLMLAVYATLMSWGPQTAGDAVLNAQLFDSPEGLRSLLLNIPLAALAFLAQIGGFAWLDPEVFTHRSSITQLVLQVAPAAVLGLIILASFIHQVRSKHYPPPLLMLAAFVLLSMLAVCFYRGLILGPQFSFSSRYKMYPQLFLLLGLLASPLMLRQIQQHASLRHGLLALCCFIYMWSYVDNLPQRQAIDQDLKQSMLYWAEDGDFQRARGYQISDADSYLFPALGHGI